MSKDGSTNTGQRGEVFQYVKDYASAVGAINAASGSPDTCVFVPPPQQGLGCKCARPRWLHCLTRTASPACGCGTACACWSHH
jgi:hypothetical protein